MIVKLHMTSLNKEDMAGLIRLSASVGWDYNEQEINTLLSAGAVFGHKNEQGDLISSSAIFPYGPQLASIGIVIVHENYRGKRLGQELVQACIQTVPTETAIMLIATEQGKPLYEKLGFQTVSSVHKYLHDNYIPTHKEDRKYEIIPLTDSLFPHVLELDRASLGADRELFLRLRIKQAKQGIVVRNNNGEIAGYGLCIQGPVYSVLGPVVAMNSDIAASIVEHLAKGCQGRLRIDVPDEQKAFTRYLKEYGFRNENQPPLMLKNARQLPVRNDTLYGIASQAFG